MVRWWPFRWPRRTRRDRAEAHARTAGVMRQEAAFAFAELRHQRRSLDAAIAQLRQTQAERGEEDE